MLSKVIRIRLRCGSPSRCEAQKQPGNYWDYALMAKSLFSYMKTYLSVPSKKMTGDGRRAISGARFLGLRG